VLESILSLRPALRFGFRPALRFGLIGVFHYTMVNYFCEMIRLIYIYYNSAYNHHFNLCASATNCNLSKYIHILNVLFTGIAFSNDGVACDCVWVGGIVSGYVVHMEHPTDVPE
jgi:hypothetical protein